MSSSNASLIGQTQTDVLKFTVKKFLKVPVLSTSERNKIKAEKGIVVFNSSLGKLQVYDGTDYISVH